MYQEISVHSFPMTFVKLFSVIIYLLLHCVLLGTVNGFNQDPLENKYGKIVHVSVVSILQMST